MRLGLASKLFAVLGGVALLAVGVTAWRVSSGVEQGFAAYLQRTELSRMADVAQRLVDFYVNNNGFASLDEEAWRAMHHAANPLAKGPRLPPPPPRPDKGGGGGNPQLDPLQFGARSFLSSPTGEHWLGRRPRPEVGFDRREIVVNGEVVAILGLQKITVPTTGADADFLAEQRHTIAQTALLVAFLSLALAAVLARYLTQRLSAVGQVAQQLAAGQETARSADTASDELGDLARDINRMADQLATHASARRRWFAQIAHELRTPLTVLRAEIESLQDGVRPLNAAALQSLKEETAHLTRLTDDLHLLANSELTQLPIACRTVDLSALLSQLLRRWQPLLDQAQLSLSSEIAPQVSLEAAAPKPH
jgi:two-component system, OmpR family, sensor histidine kinase BaeS